MMDNVEKIIKRMETLINEDNSFGAYEEYSKMLDETYGEGYKDGELSAKYDIVKKMYKSNYDIKTIAKLTGLTNNQIKNML